MKGMKVTNNSGKPFDSVSIVIPFRNEEGNLPALISSLEKQSHPGMLELVLINDHSEDESVKVAHLCTQKTRFQTRIIDLHFDPNRKLTSKQQAIDLGIHSAANNLIILTDADMTFDSEWISMLVSRMHSDSQPALVFGHTSIHPIKNIFEKFQAFQLEFLFWGTTSSFPEKTILNLVDLI
jgi:glycosyltransferase involved in cell wall biosynthesis